MKIVCTKRKCKAYLIPPEIFTAEIRHSAGNVSDNEVSPYQLGTPTKKIPASCCRRGFLVFI
jgi:hypothetical protein